MADTAINQIATSEVVTFKKKPIYDVVKRILDIICSLTALIVLTIPMLIVMLIIFIDDPGPVFFKQIRIGKNNKPFMMYKFRSMKVNAEEMKAELMEQNQDHGANFKLRHDPRRTKFGKFIRKTSIDELPQLFNILKGDMSVIGPRPFIPEEALRLPKDRHFVKPGLSCYWQIMGKNNLSEDEQIELDRRYVNERGLITDIKILMRTFKVIVDKENK